MSLTVIEQAYAKINLCLFVGPTRADGRHELVTVFDAIRFADELIVSEAPDAPADEVVCDGVSGSNLVDGALAGLRDAGWAAPTVRVEVLKRIPVAGGMAGGSADAAAMLRCAGRMAPVDPAAIARIATGLGADVPAQLVPGPSVGTGAGEVVAAVGTLAPYGVLVLPQPLALSTPDVFARADGLGAGRTSAQLSQLADRVAATLPGPLGPELTVNDLQPAAISLAPEIDGALGCARASGADEAIVCGSGPTVIGLFTGADGGRRARAAAADPELLARYPGAVAAAPVRSAQSRLRP